MPSWAQMASFFNTTYSNQHSQCLSTRLSSPRGLIEYISSTYNLLSSQFSPAAPTIMPTSNQTAGPSANTFTAIFVAASNEYRRVTRRRLDTHPFASQLDSCQSPEDFSGLLRTQAQAFINSHEADEKLMKRLTPTINILFTLSDTLGEAIALVS